MTFAYDICQPGGVVLQQIPTGHGESRVHESNDLLGTGVVIGFLLHKQSRNDYLRRRLKDAHSSKPLE